LPDNQRIADLRRRIQKDPASIAFAQLAEELRRAGEYQESIETCRAGLNAHPGYLSARVTLGRALIEVNQLEEALEELQKVLKSAPENLAAIRGLAEIYHRQGLLEQALAQYRAALALAKNDPDLERTVTELADQVEPKKPTHATEGLSFEQMQDEILSLGPPPPPAVGRRDSGFGARDSKVQSLQGSPEANPNPNPESRLPTPEIARARQTIAALEQWLGAIHVARTQPRA
jgi:tetratricopeptide (TPR) repeat protein